VCKFRKGPAFLHQGAHEAALRRGQGVKCDRRPPGEAVLDPERGRHGYEVLRRGRQRIAAALGLAVFREQAFERLGYALA
jgi:capsid protein